MKHHTLALALAGALALPAVAQAQLTFNVGATSDYRYRGISQSRLKPALQGGLDYAAGSFYVGAWASSIKWVKDAGGDAPAEIDVYAGWKDDIVKDSLAYDVGLLTYQYPGHKLAPSPVTTELYGALTFGPATLKYSHSVTNLFGFAGSRHSGYLDLSASFQLVDGLSLAPHLGYQRVAHNSDYSYTDFSLALNYEAVKGLVVSAAVVATDTRKVSGEHAYHTPAGKDLGKTSVVLGAKYNF